MIKETEVFIKVRFSETDAMGVVYHGNYLPWLEFARTSLLEELGIPYAKLQDLGYLIPVLEVNVKYLSSVKFGDEVRIRVGLKERPRVRIIMEYEIFRGDEKVTTATTTHAFMDWNGMAIKPPKIFMDAVS